MRLRPARNAVALAFVLNGLAFATLVSRVPDLRATLSLTNGQLGLLLLAIAAGSLLGLPTSGPLIERIGVAAVLRLGAVLVVTGLLVVGPGFGLVATAIGLALYGFGTGTWDVAMNVEGAEVERRLGRTVLPKFHAAWSVGSIMGAAIGVLAVRSGVSLLPHLAVLGVVAAVLAWWGAGSFLAAHTDAAAQPAGSTRSAWLEPRTLAIGAMVLAFTLAEGSANDWLALALIDGYGARHFVGVAGFGLFVCAMTAGRMLGPALLDRHGRAPILLASAASAFLGILVLILLDHPVTACLGIVLWGLGAALGFPVGMSAAADDPTRAARRVAVVSTIGYGAFLSGPPLLGFVADQVGTLDALLVIACAMVPAAILVSALRQPVPASAD